MTTINTPEEFLQALRDNPSWREAVRAELLNEELQQLPARFQAFEERMDRFIEKQEQFNERITQFLEKQEEFNNQQRIFNDRMVARFDRFEGDMSIVKAGHARIFVREAAEVIAMDWGLEYIKTLTQADLLRIYLNANGNLSPGERRSFRNADLVIETKRGHETVYIAAEISYTADYRDSDRAIRNARLLKEYTGNDAIPMVASVRNDYHVESLVETGALNWYQVYSGELRVE